MSHRIVVTGGPGSGKTEFVERLKSEPVLADFVFFNEMARQLLEENPAYRENWAEFHHKIYFRQIGREDAAAGRSFVTDRGTVDAFAFNPDTMAFMETDIEKEYRRYTEVIQLGSAASLGAEHYRTDDVRHESVEAAMRIERAITAAWSNHPGYRFVKAEVDFEKKYRNFLDAISEIIRKKIDG